MSESFTKVLVKDGRIANITDSIKYAVVKGGMNINPRQYPTSSVGSTSSQVFSIQTPSESTLIDRRIYWKATCVYRVTGTIPAGGYLLDWDVTEALGPVPLQSMCTNMQATINNSTVSVNMRDILPCLLRSNDNRILSRKNGTAPFQFDVYADYSQCINAANSPFNGFNSIYDNDLVPRGAFNVKFSNAADGTGAPVLYNPPDNSAPNGSVYITFTVMEPLLFSPFIFGDPMNDCAMYGITNMNFIFNMDQNCKRSFRSAALGVNPNNLAVSFESITDSELHIEYLTPHASDLLASKNVVPYLSYARYLTNGLANIPAAGVNPSDGNLALGLSTSYITNTFQLSNIPDRICLMLRKPMANQSYSDPDYCFVVQKLNINFNNQNGILSGATQYDLWRYAVEAGSNQSWLEFQGLASMPNPATHWGKNVATSGSFIFLEFGRHIQ